MKIRPVVMIRNISLTIVLFVFIVSCNKDNLENPVESTSEKDNGLELVSSLVSSFNFIADDERGNYVFPGSTLKIDTVGKKLTFTPFSNFTVLPVRYSSSVNGLQSAVLIPSFSTMQEYVKPIDSKKGELGGTYTYSGWEEYVDNVVLYNLEEPNKDLNNFFAILPTHQGSTISPKGVTRLVSYSTTSKFTVDVSLPVKSELMSMEDVDKLDKEVYYINSVNFGYTYKIVIEGKESADLLRRTISHYLQTKEINKENQAILENMIMYYYLRTSSSKDAIFEKAKGKNEIVSLIARMEQEMATIGYKYPISYKLRNVKNFELFKHSYTNSWYAKIIR